MTCTVERGEIFGIIGGHRGRRGGRRGPRRLFISEAGVKTHLPHVCAKLGVNDRAAAVAAAFQRGLLPRG